MSITRPDKVFSSKWAEKGERFEINDVGADHNNGRADIETGFPQKTMVSVLKGGIPPWGRDHNGILYRITEAIQWMQAGGLPSFNQDFCHKNGGYAQGTILQGSDPNRPWVLWMSLVDNNVNDPNQNKINVSAPQKGWRRYPVIEDKDGATLYYNDNGELAIFTSQNTSTKYVSWSTGNDQTGDGSRIKPYKTIDKAITVSPASGQIVIKILDTDDHYLVGMNDTVVQDLNAYTPGPVYNDDDHITEQPYETIAGTINVGIRTVIIQPYQNPQGDPNGVDGWEELINLVQAYTGDGWWGYCMDEDVLASRGLRRPTLYKMWCYTYIRGERYWRTISTRYCGFNGVQGSFSVWFLGIKMSTYNFDDLNNAEYSMSIGFEMVGGDYVYNGVIIDRLPTSDIMKYSFGGTDITSSSLSFRRSNYFVDYTQGIKSIFMHVNSKTAITITKVDGMTIDALNYKTIKNNAVDFLGRQSSYTQTTLTMIEKPSPHYAYLDVNVEIT